MRVFVTYTILDTIEVEDFCGTEEDFVNGIYKDAEATAEEIYKAVGLRPNDIEVELVGN